MSRDGHEGWDSPTRSRDTDSSPRSHRRRGSGHGDERRPSDERDDDEKGRGKLCPGTCEARTIPFRHGGY